MPFVPNDDSSDTVLRGTDDALGSRLTARALAADGHAGERFFQSLGYETSRWGDGDNGWQWKYRHQGTTDPWNPANPKGLDVGDLADFVSHALTYIVGGVGAGVGASIGAAGGPVGSIAGGMAGGGLATAGAEMLRQGAGSLAGIPGNTSASEVALAGAGGALAEPVGAVVGAGVRAVGRTLVGATRLTGELAPEIAARVVGIKALGATTGGKVLMEGVERTQGGRVLTPTIAAATRTMRGALSYIKEAGISQVRTAETAIAGAGNAGVTADIARAMQEIEARTVGTAAATTGRLQVESATSPALKREAADLLDRLAEIPGYSANWAKMPVEAAYKIKQVLQNVAYGKGVGPSGSPSAIFQNFARGAAAQVRAGVANAMEPVFPGFGDTMREAERMTVKFNDWNDAFRLGSNTAADITAAETTMKGLYGSSKSSLLRGLQELQQQFLPDQQGDLLRRATRALSVARRANIGAVVGERGRGAMIGSRGILGHLAGPIAVGSTLLGHPELAVASIAAASPRMAMKVAGPVASGFGVASDLAARLAKAQFGSFTRVVSQGVLTGAQVSALRQVINAEGGGSKGIAREKAAPKSGRKLVFVGQ